MKENLVIFLIIILLFIAIAVVGYVIFLLQERMRIARTGATTTGSDTSSHV
jgi:flagellar basal body-associated protein FliL